MTSNNVTRDCDQINFYLSVRNENLLLVTLYYCFPAILDCDLLKLSVVWLRPLIRGPGFNVDMSYEQVKKEKVILLL